MLRSLTPTEQRIVHVGLFTVLIVVLVTLASINRLRLFHSETDLRLLKDRFADYQRSQDTKEKALRAELEEIERTLYAAPDVPPPPIRRTSAVETWMANREQELRNRVAALERRLYRLEQ